MKSIILAIAVSAMGAMADRYYSCGHMLVNDPCESSSFPSSHGTVPSN
jgi:hypothetical protein